MFRGKKSGAAKAPRRILGIIMAVAGIALIIDKVPVFLWWVVLGVGLILSGWRIYAG